MKNRKKRTREILTDAVVEIRHIKKSFNKKTILEDINATIYPGDRIALVGANGSGKSLLSEIIGQLIEPTSGKIIYRFDNPKRHIGMLLNGLDWPPGVRVCDAINLYRWIYKDLDETWINLLIAHFKLQTHYKKYITQLTPEYKQLFNMVISIIHNPSLIIFDRSLTDVDLQWQYVVRKIISEVLFNDNTRSAIFITHLVNIIQDLCNRIWLIHEGKILIDDTVENIVVKYGSVETFLDNYFKGNL
ncbi:ATP-binding cassette domain-containing protein [Spiroplasma sp. DGKH1]|uniref:ATP-binding cassette domain-containing protein n=1 Tax=Spiroplasma sp. DGKH1 TaxID=3050074 RepID=UPI0034C6437C